MLKQGGLQTYIDLAETRSKMLYDFVDNSNGFYKNLVEKKYRSQINVPIRIRPDQGENSSTYTRLENKFIEEAAKLGLLQLRGHKASPGIRVSMYNAMSIQGVQALIDFMRTF